jgi:hypothetical protein
MARLQAGNIGVEVFQSESKLVAIDPFRPPSELRALETPNDELESVDPACAWASSDRSPATCAARSRTNWCSVSTSEGSAARSMSTHRI